MHNDREKALYGIMFLAGEARENWHLANSLSDIDDYTWKDITDSVLDAVEDPTNRTLSTIVAYEQARQTDTQTVQAFATYLATLEDQMEPYTPTQRAYHLLAKLKPALRTSIVTHHDVPAKREELVSLATRMEQANRTAGAAQSSSRRPDGKSHAERNQTRSSSKRPRTGSHTEPRERSDRAPQSGRTEGAAEVTCYGCNEKGHYKSNCPHPEALALAPILTLV